MQAGATMALPHRSVLVISTPLTSMTYQLHAPPSQHIASELPGSRTVEGGTITATTTGSSASLNIPRTTVFKLMQKKVILYVSIDPSPEPSVIVKFRKRRHTLKRHPFTCVLLPTHRSLVYLFIYFRDDCL